RELQNLIERAVIRADNGVLPNPLHISDENPVMQTPLSSSHENSVQTMHAQGTFWSSQRALILQSLQAAGLAVGGPVGAAERLGMKRTTLISKMKKLGISRPGRAFLHGIHGHEYGHE